MHAAAFRLQAWRAVSRCRRHTLTYTQGMGMWTSITHAATQEVNGAGAPVGGKPQFSPGWPEYFPTR